MNAAFVILASALLGNPPAAAPCNNCSAPAPAACSTCGSGHSWSFGNRLRGMFSCHSCKTEAPCAAPCAAPAPAPCATPCSTCGHSHGPILGKWRGLFSGHSSQSCNSCAPACDGCGSAPAATAPSTIPPAGGDAPKKMPDAPKGDAPKADAPKGDKAVQFQETPEAPLAVPGLNPVDNVRPKVIAAPATLRNPF